MFHLWNPAGGIPYHLRAIRYRKSLWRPFREAVSEWFTTWHPLETELILIGPSAGHCLPLEKFARFSKITVLEPDLLARAVLKHRLRHIAPNAALVFVPDATRALKTAFVSVLEKNPKASVLFANILGQVPLLAAYDERTFRSQWLHRTQKLLEGRSWASLHDRLSGSLPARALVVHRDHQIGNSELIESFYPQRSRGEVIDHQTRDLFPENLPRRFFSWSMAPGHVHIIEGVSTLLG